MTKFTQLLEIIANVVYWCGRNASLSITTVYQIYQHQNVVQIQLLLAYKFFTWEITTVMVSNKDILHTAGWSRNVQSFTAYGWYMGSCLSYFFLPAASIYFCDTIIYNFFFSWNNWNLLSFISLKWHSPKHPWPDGALLCRSTGYTFLLSQLWFLDSSFIQQSLL